MKEGKKKGAFSRIEVAKNWKQNGTDRHEINISEEYIGERSVEDTIVTLMHEMVYLYANRMTEMLKKVVDNSS